MARAKAKARLVLDQLFKAVPAAMIGSCVQVWAAHSADIDVSTALASYCHRECS